MRDFLDEYIYTLSGRRQERVYDLLRAAKTDKANLDNIAKKLKDMSVTAPLMIAPDGFNSRIDASKFNGTQRDVFEKLAQLFSTSNDISLLLDTHTSVLTSEIKAIEDEIDAMTKTMQSYAFTLADNGAYDFAYIETFNDDTMRLESDPSTVTDRTGINFNSDEGAHVNSASGTLTLAPALQVSYNVSGEITNSNCAAYVTSDTGLSNALNGSVGTGWRVAVSSPRPVSSTILGQTRQGAQFQIELSLLQQAPADSVVVTPFAERPFEILSLDVILPQDDSGQERKITLVDTPTVVDKPTDYGFPMQNIESVRILVNQPAYTRGKLPAFKPEERHRKLYGKVTMPVVDPSLPEPLNVFRRNRKALVRVVTSTLQNSVSSKDLRILRGQVPHINFDPRKGPMNVRDFINNGRKNYGTEGIWKAHSEINTIFRRMIHERILSSHPEGLSGRMVWGNTPLFSNANSQLTALLTGSDIMPVPDEAKVSTNVNADMYASLQENANFLNYEYDLGFRNIQIGYGARIFRGVYVTKPLPADSDSGEVRIKTDEINYSIINSDRDSQIVTSVEYSVTNVSDPKREEDWIPILPIQDTDTEIIIEGERVFFTDAGSCRFRFPASKQGGVTLYRNGYVFDQNLITYVDGSDGFTSVGCRLPIGVIFPTDIFTADYRVYGDPSTINFEQWGFDRANLASAYDENGAGETFFGTYNGRTIQVNYSPYVDYNLAEAQGFYTSEGFIGSYQPVTIVLADGTLAKNQTNYKGLTQNNLATFDDTETAFIHSGRNITFNRIMDERFTVYYQYLPSNLKVRIVLRVNDLYYVSPQVNTVQVKTKTRKADAKGDV